MIILVISHAHRHGGRVRVLSGLESLRIKGTEPKVGFRNLSPYSQKTGVWGCHLFTARCALDKVLSFLSFPVCEMST